MIIHDEYMKQGDDIYYYYGYINKDNVFIIEYKRKVMGFNDFIKMCNNEEVDIVTYEYNKVIEDLRYRAQLLGNKFDINIHDTIESNFERLYMLSYFPNIQKDIDRSSMLHYCPVFEKDISESNKFTIPYVEIIRDRIKREGEDITIIERIYKPI